MLITESVELDGGSSFAASIGSPERQRNRPQSRQQTAQEAAPGRQEQTEGLAGRKTKAGKEPQSELAAAAAESSAWRQAEVKLAREAEAEAKRRSTRRADSFFRTGRAAVRLKPMMSQEVRHCLFACVCFSAVLRRKTFCSVWCCGQKVVAAGLVVAVERSTARIH